MYEINAFPLNKLQIKQFINWLWVRMLEYIYIITVIVYL